MHPDFSYTAFTTVALSGILGAALLCARKRTRGDVRPIIIGAATFFTFALLFEQVLHQVLILLLPSFQVHVAERPLYYVLYGCSMAAIFEEGGRYFAFTRIMPDYREIGAAISYGIGHGGLELLIAGIIGLTVSAHAFAATESALWIFERCAALLGHVSLSVIVFTAAATQLKSLFLLAVFLHGVADVPIGLYRYGLIDLPACDALFGLAVFACCIIALFVRRTTEARMHRERG